MSQGTEKTFDCVKQMRDIRSELDDQLAQMTSEERIRWIRSYRYSDPLLQRLIDRAGEQAKALQ